MGKIDSHPRTTVTSASVADDRVAVDWADGHESRFHGIWLRHNCSCTACGTSETAMRALRIDAIPDDIMPQTVAIDDDGGLHVVWPGDGHISRYDATWLRDNCYSDTERSRRRWRPVYWGPEIAADPPEVDFETAQNDDVARLSFLENLRDYGFALVNNVPTDPEATKDIAALAGPLRVTNYGSVYDFRYTPTPLVYGDSEVGLNPHTDEPYRQAPPSITLFHFVKAAERGGESILVDTFRVGQALRDRDPEAFDLLAHQRVTFHRRLEKQDRDFRMQAPVFSLDDEGEIAGSRLLDRAIGPLHLDEDLVVPYYRALKQLIAMLFDEANQLRVPVATGQTLFFNNQRVLHGRTAFDVGSDRYMRTCHVELDEFYSTLRTLSARLGTEGVNMVLPAGALV